VKKYIQDTVHQQFDENVDAEEQAQTILRIALSALEELKKACDKAPAHEGEASTSRV